MNEKKKVMILLAIVFVIVALIGSAIIIDNMKSNKVYQEFENTLKNSKNEIIMIGNSNYPYSQTYQSMLDNLSELYNFKYLYVNTNNITSGTLYKILDQLDVDPDDFDTLLTAITKDGKVIDVQNDFVSEEKELFDFLQKNNLISKNAEYNDPNKLTMITASQFADIVKSNERSVIVIGQTTCIHCINAKPILNEIVADEGIVINYINYDKLSNEDRNLVLNSLEYLTSTQWGTPLMLVVENNNLINQYPGETTKENYINFLKANGVIK